MAKEQFSFYRDKADEWRWRRTASNGEVVGASSASSASSEGYKNLHDCERNASLHGWGVSEQVFPTKNEVIISKQNAKIMREFLISLLLSEVVKDEVKNQMRPIYEELLELEL